LDDTTTKRTDGFATAWERTGRAVVDLHNGIRELPVSSDALRPDVVRQAVESRFDFAQPVPLPELTEQVIGLLREYSVHVTHPRYFGLFNPTVPEAAVIADALVALYNPQLAAWSHAPAANELERVTLRYLADALGLDPDMTFANFTSGGLEANFSAVVVALAHGFPEYDRGGIAALGTKPTIYVTGESHHSFIKICRMTGLGTDALIQVPTTSAFAMDTAALRDMIARDVKDGRTPLMIVGTAGTTAGGIVDPLEALADIAAASRVWFHVDAAWGGAAVLVPRLRSAVRGIERADSVTWDAHKWLSVPMGAGMFFCRHRVSVSRAFDVSASYMPPAGAMDTTDLYRASFQWSRRAIGVKLFMSLAERGSAAFTEQIEQQARMGDLLRVKLTDAGWTVVNDTILPVVCMTHDTIREGRRTTTEMVESIQARGLVWISEVVLGGDQRALRACITSYRTTPEDLDVLVAELERARNVGAGAP
jgi:glutamate/tyrosine decarboxylase-like PLP-dependent enzyme